MIRPRRIFISVAEDSADIHAAALMRAAAAHHPHWTFHGLTGPRMRALGAETVFDMTAHAAMLTGVARIVGRAWRALRAVERSWRASRPDCVVLLDSPELHLRLARRARGMGLPVVYYIAPQTWASREGRIARIARDIDRLACILPFEEPYFRRHGVRAAFVGHPLFESLAHERPNAENVARLRQGRDPLIAVLPGSRKHVIDAMLPRQLDVLRRLRKAGVRFRAAVSAVDADRRNHIRRLLAAQPKPRTENRPPAGGAKKSISVPPVRNPVSHRPDADAPQDIESLTDNASLLTAADLVLVASGTATLHVAHYRKPMIVMYDVGPILGPLYARWGHWVVRSPHLSLVNVLAGRRIVPEYMPSVRDTAVVAKTAAALLRDAGWRSRIVADLEDLCGPLESSQASEKVCRLVAELLGPEAAGGSEWPSGPGS